MKEYLIKFFDKNSIDEAILILNEYTGSECERVRKAIIKLSVGSIDGLKYFTKCANKDYRDVLYWAEYSDEAKENLKKFLGGMTVNERLSHLDLMEKFDEAIKKKDKDSLRLLLLQCDLSKENIENIIKAKT